MSSDREHAGAHCGPDELSPTNKPRFVPAHEPSPEEGYQKAVSLLQRLTTPDGFIATLTDRANYRRVWSRDGIICGLAALLSDDTELIAAFKRTLLTLAHYQGPQGEIPSNVDTAADRISYGGTTGRVDADLWFVIGCAEYWQATDSANGSSTENWRCGSERPETFKTVSRPMVCGDRPDPWFALCLGNAAGPAVVLPLLQWIVVPTATLAILRCFFSPVSIFRLRCGEEE